MRARSYAHVSIVIRCNSARFVICWIADKQDRSMNALKSAMVGVKSDRPLVFNRMMVTLWLICLVATGCALIKLKQEVRQVLASTVLVGRRN